MGRLLFEPLTKDVSHWPSGAVPAHLLHHRIGFEFSFYGLPPFERESPCAPVRRVPGKWYEDKFKPAALS